VTVTVSDETDETTTDPVTIVVGNIATVAGFTYVATNLSVEFTDTSTDVNGDTLTYSWDFDTDGVAENITAGPVTYAYAAAGAYNATLTVTDAFGLTNEYMEAITVTE